MAAKRVTKKDKPQYRCRDCAHSYDWNEIGADGKPFLCRCPFYTKGKFCRFLKDPACDNFKLK